ncbi:MAG TPA: hypothetical protein VG345_16580 [Bryobacteraceae bacterium]|jgi:hypothetical protein|nr:hypothetical protein [Bryobacteraceae bacterium]
MATSTVTPPAAPAHSSIFRKLASLLGHACVTAAEWFKAEVGPEAETIAAGLKALLETEVGQLARTAVAEAQLLETGAEKWAAAKTKIVSALETAGKTVESSTVNLALEAAVTELKGAYTTAE